MDMEMSGSMSIRSLSLCKAIIAIPCSLGAKCPSVVVRDNLKVFFSRYQNRYKDILPSICPPAEISGDAMSTDEDTNTPNPPRTSSSQQMALTRCDLPVLFVKTLMDLFAPHLTRQVTCTPNSNPPPGCIDLSLVIVTLLLHYNPQCSIP
jgi:hypothetical protein